MQAFGRDRWVALPRYARAAHENLGTRIATSRHERVDYRLEFLRHYSGFRDLLRAETQPGVAVVAIDRTEQRVSGVGFVAARIGEPNALIVGRHTAADLKLLADDTLSLRHLALIVEPLTDLRPGRGVVYRVVDLRSGTGLRTEHGQVLGGLRADGPSFFQIGRYIFFVLVTGDPTDWAASATDAWSFIPERIYLAEQRRYARGSDRRPAVPLNRAHTLIQETVQPSRLSGRSLLEPDERPIAELVLNNERRISVGRRALEEGILIGRANRCDGNALLADPRLSRVHLLILSISTYLYAIDTTSTNKSYVRDAHAPFRMHAIDFDTHLNLSNVAELNVRHVR